VLSMLVNFVEAQSTLQHRPDCLSFDRNAFDGLKGEKGKRELVERLTEKATLRT
jgi:hypothetical protein